MNTHGRESFGRSRKSRKIASVNTINMRIRRKLTMFKVNISKGFKQRTRKDYHLTLFKN